MKAFRKARWFGAAVVVLALVIASPALGAGNSQVNPGVIPPQASFRGASYGEWSAKWWYWAFALPFDGHPLNDLTGKDAATGQSGNVWFLGGLWWPNDSTPPAGPVTRQITVPAGTALFFPIVNGENNFVEVPSATTIEELWDTQAWLDAYGDQNLYATIDGRPLHNLTAYRAPAPVFYVCLPEDNALQAWGIDFTSGCIDPVVADGFFLMVQPLSVGKHQITFGVKDVGWTLDIIYDITVVPGKKTQ